MSVGEYARERMRAELAKRRLSDAAAADVNRVLNELRCDSIHPELGRTGF